MTPAPGGYRVAANLEFRASHLEQELASAHEEVLVTRRLLVRAHASERSRRGLSAVYAGGLGAVVGWFGGVVGYVVTLDVRWPLFLPFVGLILTFVCAMRWEPPDENSPKNRPYP